MRSVAVPQNGSSPASRRSRLEAACWEVVSTPKIRARGAMDRCVAPLQINMEPPNLAGVHAIRFDVGLLTCVLLKDLHM